ncbi:hypothetical protein BGT96224_2261 [Blumeria graminis f. sp. tritici 96224]|uniref:Bgt-2261 n=2 Tax=Blumeria graminis f. sp. tritici TaxID=62690 RepID=A0A381LCQ5_BLUGR|nr:hypothetical protein BGT96224_2261 [Blumeria graminis f. sp. tritici 96224]
MDTALVTFMVQTPPSTQTVHLIGSWDNFKRRYHMERDSQRSRGQWRGCYRFQDIICDGNDRNKVKRSGGLKMGTRYYYYFELDGSEEYHDVLTPFTTSCPYLPGQPVNYLWVPTQMPSQRHRRASTSSVIQQSRQTINPADRFTSPHATTEIRSTIGRPHTSVLAWKRKKSSISTSAEFYKALWLSFSLRPGQMRLSVAGKSASRDLRGSTPNNRCTESQRALSSFNLLLTRPKTCRTKTMSSVLKEETQSNSSKPYSRIRVHQQTKEPSANASMSIPCPQNQPECPAPLSPTIQSPVFTTKIGNSIPRHERLNISSSPTSLVTAETLAWNSELRTCATMNSSYSPSESTFSFEGSSIVSDLNDDFLYTDTSEMTQPQLETSMRTVPSYSLPGKEYTQCKGSLVTQFTQSTDTEEFGLRPRSSKDICDNDEMTALEYLQIEAGYLTTLISGSA